MLFAQQEFIKERILQMLCHSRVWVALFNRRIT
jgi:hypothetical protein